MPNLVSGFKNKRGGGGGCLFTESDAARVDMTSEDEGECGHKRPLHRLFLFCVKELIDNFKR